MSALSFLYGYPDWVIILVIMAMASLACVSAMLVLHPFLRVPDDGATRDLALRVMSSIVAVNTFMLAFSVIQVRGELVKIEQNVGAEAAAVGQLDRLLLRYQSEASRTVRST